MEVINVYTYSFKAVLMLRKVSLVHSTKIRVDAGFEKGCVVGDCENIFDLHFQFLAIFSLKCSSERAFVLLWGLDDDRFKPSRHCPEASVDVLVSMPNWKP